MMHITKWFEVVEMAFLIVRGGCPFYDIPIIVSFKRTFCNARCRGRAYINTKIRRFQPGYQGSLSFLSISGSAICLVLRLGDRDGELFGRILRRVAFSDLVRLKIQCVRQS